MRAYVAVFLMSGRFGGGNTVLSVRGVTPTPPTRQCVTDSTTGHNNKRPKLFTRGCGIPATPSRCCWCWKTWSNFEFNWRPESTENSRERWDSNGLVKTNNRARISSSFTFDHMEKCTKDVMFCYRAVKKLTRNVLGAPSHPPND